MTEWFRFAVTALFLAGALSMAVISVAGVFKFKFILNRMHAAAICDSFVLLLAMIGVAVSYGFSAATLKVCLIVLLIWMASPVSGHLIARLEVTTDKHLSEECEVRE
ncbi:MAG: monovalent cation/H(+) antiporter subunit G [Lachnospiraceae bacterium]|nr:monovalent cation/H(+) antiporter subunit G [Lachnospiraceae bacterium]